MTSYHYINVLTTPFETIDVVVFQQVRVPMMNIAPEKIEATVEIIVEKIEVVQEVDPPP